VVDPGLVADRGACGLHQINRVAQIHHNPSDHPYHRSLLHHGMQRYGLTGGTAAIVTALPGMSLPG
jgi:hypothetical protein